MKHPELIRLYIPNTIAAAFCAVICTYLFLDIFIKPMIGGQDALSRVMITVAVVTLFVQPFFFNAAITWYSKAGVFNWKRFFLATCTGPVIALISSFIIAVIFPGGFVRASNSVMEALFVMAMSLPISVLIGALVARINFKYIDKNILSDMEGR